MKILVSGGAGFIGSHLIPKLLKQGHEVVSIDNYCTGKKENEVSGCRYYEGDIVDIKDYSSFIKNPDYVLHLAYPYGVDGMGLHEAYIDTGLVGTYNLLSWSTKVGVKKLVNISSVSAYGIITESPVKETMKGPHYIHYGVTKKASEEYCKIFKGTYGLDTVNLRLFYAYGERYATFDHSALVNFLDRSMKNKPLMIYGDGKQLRSYTYVSDIVDGIINSMEGVSNGKVYNISGGSVCSILELAKTVVKVTGKDSEIKFANQDEFIWSDEWVKIPLGLTRKNSEGNWIDERNYVASNSKARKDFNYNPKVKLEDGIKRMWDWMNQ